MAVRPTEISDIIRQQIAGFDDTTSLTNVGTVVSIGDGIANVYGLSNVMASELVEFPRTGTTGLAFNLAEDSVGVLVLGDYREIEEGDEVRATGQVGLGSGRGCAYRARRQRAGRADRRQGPDRHRQAATDRDHRPRRDPARTTSTSRCRPASRRSTP